MHQPFGTTLDPVLGDRPGQVSRGHEDADGHGLSLCQNQCHISQQKAGRGEQHCTVPFPVHLNASFLSVRQMLEFILAQPAVVERILQHIETPAFSDLLVRIIQLDEQPVGAGVLEVCRRLPAYAHR